MPTAALDLVLSRYMVSCATENRSNFSASTQVPNLRPFPAVNTVPPPRHATVCETIFYFLLLGYTTGIHAQYQRSCSRGEGSGKRRESTDAWQTANRLAEQALQYAIAATAQAAVGDYIQADNVAKDASERLKARLVLNLCRAWRNVSLTIDLPIAFQLHPRFTNGKSATLCRSGI